MKRRDTEEKRETETDGHTHTHTHNTVSVTSSLVHSLMVTMASTAAD